MKPETRFVVLLLSFCSVMSCCIGFTFGMIYAVPALQITIDRRPPAPAMAYSQEYSSVPVIIGGYSVDTGPNGNVVIVGNCDQKGGK